MADSQTSVKKFISDNLVYIIIAIFVLIAIIFYYRKNKNAYDTNIINMADDMSEKFEDVSDAGNIDNIDKIVLKANDSDRTIINKRLEQLCQTQGDITNS